MGPEVEYPDNAGYPDGMGFLDEGTAADLAPSALAVELDEPSTELDDDVVVVSEETAYRAVLGGHEVVTMHVARGPGVVTMRSTVVDPSVRGIGLATAFIAHVLDDIGDQGTRVIVECPEVARFLELHPEYAHLRA
jgi:predicted GNAT family acetyltransferase